MTQCECGRTLETNDERCRQCGLATSGWDSAEGLRVYEEWLKEFAADGIFEDWEQQEIDRLRLEKRIRVATHQAMKERYQSLSEGLPLELEIDASTVQEFVEGTAGVIRARIRNHGDRPVRNVRVLHAVPGVASLREHVSRMLAPNHDEVFTMSIECSRAGKFTIESLVGADHISGTAIRYRTDLLGYTVAQESSENRQSESETHDVDGSEMGDSLGALATIAGVERSRAARWVMLRLQSISAEAWEAWEARHDGALRKAAEEAAREQEEQRADAEGRSETETETRTVPESEAVEMAATEWVGPSSKYAMQKVPAQTFQMGSSKGSNNPVHSVTLSSAYWIGVYPMYQSLWKYVMGTNPSSGQEEYSPVTDVSWLDVVEFANKLSELDGLLSAYQISGKSVTWDRRANGYRLPTEAEWECAARAETSLEYSGSNILEEAGWFVGNSDGRSHNVGGKCANGYGLHDLSGNVWEWCWDWFDSLTAASVTDPVGANAASRRVNRGGSWINGADVARVAYRNFSDPTNSYDRLGVRLVRST